MKTLYSILIIVIGFSTSLYSQKKETFKGADREYKHTAYINAAETLERVADKGYESADLYKKLGNAYYFNRNMKDAAIWYNKLVNLGLEDLGSEYYFRFAQALKTIEEDELAKVWMKRYFEKASDSSVSSKYAKSLETVKSFRVKNAEFNSPFSDFGATLHNGQLIFSSSRDQDTNYSWNNQPYLDLYVAESPQNPNFTRVHPWLAGKFNTQYHESSVAITNEGSTIYFTGNNVKNGYEKRDKKGVTLLQLFRTTMGSDGNWSKPTKLPFNDNSYNTAHPTISKTGDIMIFSSDMPGSKGLADLFFVQISENGSLGSPQSLGDSINSEATESFPFLNEDGDLYFSSDGHPGLGGLDVFVIKGFLTLLSNDNLSRCVVQHLPSPINSTYDDFAFTTYDEGNRGYVSSNRPDGVGDDDIYSFEAFEKCSVNIKGVVTDRLTKKVLPYAKVTLMHADGTHVAETRANRNAEFSFVEQDCEDGNMLLRAEKEGYAFSEKRWEVNKLPKQTFELVLNPIKTQYGVGDDLTEALNIENIYFDYNQHDIRYDAEIELQKVIEVLHAYPNMKISIRSHTDCRGAKLYNKHLSQKRAKATLNYLVRNGISPTRLSAKGYGESQLIEHCDCKTCSSVKHQANRRSEFIITTL